MHVWQDCFQQFLSIKLLQNLHYDKEILVFKKHALITKMYMQNSVIQILKYF